MDYTTVIITSTIFPWSNMLWLLSWSNNGMWHLPIRFPLFGKVAGKRCCSAQ